MEKEFNFNSLDVKYTVMNNNKRTDYSYVGFCNMCHKPKQFNNTMFYYYFVKEPLNKFFVCDSCGCKNYFPKYILDIAEDLYAKLDSKYKIKR